MFKIQILGKKEESFKFYKLDRSKVKLIDPIYSLWDLTIKKTFYHIT